MIVIHFKVAVRDFRASFVAKLKGWFKVNIDVVVGSFNVAFSMVIHDHSLATKICSRIGLQVA